MGKKGVKTETQPIDWDDAMMLLDRLRDKDDNSRLMFACGFYFGLRISDVLLLRWIHILGDHFTIKEEKNEKHRRITLNDNFKLIRDQVIANLREPPNEEELIFIYKRKGSDKNKPISITAANKRIKKYFTLYKIKVENPSSHTLRKTFGKKVYESNGCSEDALVKLSEVFNHSNVAITRRYIGLTRKVIEDIYLSI